MPQRQSVDKRSLYTKEPKSPDAIDTEPLTGKARNDFEAGLFKTVKRSRQLVLRIILDHAAGKADCWPSNARIAEIAGYQPRNVQLILRALEADQVIRCVVDRSLRTQRRIVVLDHPDAVRVLSALGDCPWMNSGAQEKPAKQPPKVHPGAQVPVRAGAQIPVGAGAQGSPSEFEFGSKSKLEIPFFSPPRREENRPLTQAELLASIRMHAAKAATASPGGTP
jgi:hypothetical protein